MFLRRRRSSSSMRRLPVSSGKFWFFASPKFISCHSADLSLFGPGGWGCQGRAGFARRSEPLTTPPARPYPRYEAEWQALSPPLALRVSRLSRPRFPDLTHIPCFYSHSWLSLPMGSVHVGFRYS